RSTLGFGVEERRALRIRVALIDIAHVLAVKQRSLSADMDEAPRAGLTCDLQQLTRSFDVGVPELLARAPLLHERRAVDDGLAACNRVRGHRAELATDRRRSERADRSVAVLRSREGAQ